MVVPIDRLATVFVEFAGTLVDEFDVVGFLSRGGQTAELLEGSHVGLPLGTRGG